MLAEVQKQFPKPYFLNPKTCLQAALALASVGAQEVGEPLAADRLFDCVNVILSYQNPTGGWATYENTRSFAWVEASFL